MKSLIRLMYLLRPLCERLKGGKIKEDIFL